MLGILKKIINERGIITTISWLLVILWMSAIFWFSDMNGNVSTHRSKQTINNVITDTIDITNKLGITDKHPSKKEINNITNKLNYPLRKLMHTGEYFILVILLYNAFYQSGVRSKKLVLYSLLICFLYACSDEFHQLFRERTGHFSDVLIDTMGGVIAIITLGFVKKIKNKL